MDPIDEELRQQAISCTNECVNVIRSAIRDFMALSYEKYDFRAALTGVVVALTFLLDENEAFVEKVRTHGGNFMEIQAKFGISDEQMKEAEQEILTRRVRLAAKDN